MNLSRFFTIMVVLAIAGATTGTLHDIYKIMDLSNVDLANFQYFKYPPNAKMLLNPITDHFQKKKAVLTYFRNVLLGNPAHGEERIIAFDPDFGKKWKPRFEQHFGKKGERLIELLGKGYSPQKLMYYGAIPKPPVRYYHHHW